MAANINVKVTWNARKGEYVFTCPTCGEQWTDDEYPEIKAMIRKHGICPCCRKIILPKFTKLGLRSAAAGEALRKVILKLKRR